MKISTKGLYAVRLMLYLAEHDGGGPVSLKEVSESLGISKKYLEQIVSNVVTAKLVRSVRGAAGGYQLAKPASVITVLDVLRVGKVGLPTFARLAGQYAKGLYWKYPALIQDYHGQEVSFSAREPITVVVDGEVMKDTAFTVRLSEKKVNFFYPAGASYAPGL